MQKLAFDDPVDKTLSPQMCDALAKRIKGDIDAWCAKNYADEHRTHLGASVIGDDCSRRIWYSFRWCKTEIFGGRQLRLFNRGHLEEHRWIEWLRGIGFTIWDQDSDGKQFRIVGANGHYGGSADSIGQTPYPELIGLNLLCEYKTHNAGSFKQLLDKGMIVSKPEHYAQMCEYGVTFGLKYGLYCASSKNDDDHHIEVVKLDPVYANDLVKKAEAIIYSPFPPPKISLQPEFYECKFCPHKGICHQGEPIERNCRSCRHSRPVENARWYCDHHQGLIPPDFVPQGCGDWFAIV